MVYNPLVKLDDQEGVTMDKFRRTILDRQGLSFKESIQKNIDMAKELGRTITWKQAKSMERS